MISVVLLLVAFSIDWAKTYKPVNYKYTAGKNKQFRGYGCPKGSFPYFNDSAGGTVGGDGTEWKGDHIEQSKCEECKTIKKDFIQSYFFPVTPLVSFTVDDAEMEKFCNGQTGEYKYEPTVGNIYTGSDSLPSHGCFWNKNKKTCGATSCPYKAAIETCNGNWTGGKCVKNKGATCWALNYLSHLPDGYSDDYYRGYSGSYAFELCGDNSYAPINNWGTPSGCAPGTIEGKYLSCDKLGDYYKWVQINESPGYKFVKFSGDEVKQCNWECTHPQRGPYYETYDYTIRGRKECNKVYGCLYSDWAGQSCSYWAIWAFILFLVLLILFVIAIIVVIVILVIKLCGKKTTKVEDGAAAQSKSASQPAPVDSSPPPPSGPYVVIKLGKQEKQTKKVQSSQWGESIVFTGLGAEDDDVEIELHADSGALLGNVNIRIPEYVNAKKRATLTLKSGEADIGVLETDIEIQVQEEPEVKITGVFYVDKFTKA